MAETTVIVYISPVFTAILAALFLKETLRANEIAGLVISMAGLLLVAQPVFLCRLSLPRSGASSSLVKSRTLSASWVPCWS